MGTLILITFGCTGFLIIIVGFILEKIIEHNHRESEKVIKKYIDECIKANADTGEKQCNLPVVSEAKRKLPMAIVVRKNAKIMDYESFVNWYNDAFGNSH